MTASTRMCNHRSDINLKKYILRSQMSVIISQKNLLTLVYCWWIDFGSWSHLPLLLRIWLLKNGFWFWFCYFWTFRFELSSEFRIFLWLYFSLSRRVLFFFFTFICFLNELYPSSPFIHIQRYQSPTPSIGVSIIQPLDLTAI